MDGPADRLCIESGELYAGYALDGEVRAAASSGGVVSAILLELLARGHAGALVSGIVAGEQGVRAATMVATTRAEVLANAGSSYIDTPVLQKIHELRDAPGPFAVVALPCQVRALRRLMERQPELREKFWPVIGLFCRGNVTEPFYDDFFRSMKVDPRRVQSVKVSRGHVKGRVVAKLGDGGEVSFPFMRLNAYRLAGIHAKSLCAWCDEHNAAQADIAVGDIFTPEFKRREIKHSAFVARDERCAALLEDLVARGVLTAERVGMDRYHQAFRRIERFSNQQASRRLGAMLAGMGKPVGELSGRFNVFHCLAWTIILLNGRLSQSRWGRRLLYAMPRAMISGMAFVVKGLSRL